RAQVIDPSGQSPDAVRFGATVLLMDVESGEEVSYTLVGEDESDVAKGLISVTSPVGRALMGKPIDEVVRVQVPRGTRELEIREIRFESFERTEILVVVGERGRPPLHGVAFRGPDPMIRRRYP